MGEINLLQCSAAKHWVPTGYHLTRITHHSDPLRHNHGSDSVIAHRGMDTSSLWCLAPLDTPLQSLGGCNVGWTYLVWAVLQILDHTEI